jgi:endonuclease/exonuclease/phosphatase family metal-dependent hydrolase
MSRVRRHPLRFPGLLLLATLPLLTHAQSNMVVRVMAANLTGNSQIYGAPQVRILQGLKPDIVCIQEFRYATSSQDDIRYFVTNTFGTTFSYFRESGFAIPNGVISRWPILNAGSWDDPEIPDRGFAWAQIDLPGTNDLYAVSVHLSSGGGSAVRANEAAHLKALIQANFPAGSWVIVAGDMNTDTRSESAMATFTTFLSDSPIPSDSESGGDEDTNTNRNKPTTMCCPVSHWRAS